MVRLFSAEGEGEVLDSILLADSFEVGEQVSKFLYEPFAAVG